MGNLLKTNEEIAGNPFCVYRLWVKSNCIKGIPRWILAGSFHTPNEANGAGRKEYRRFLSALSKSEYPETTWKGLLDGSLYCDYKITQDILVKGQ